MDDHWYLPRPAQEDRLLAALSRSPAVVLLGARQVGKTTLAHRVAERIGSESIYLDMERTADRRKLEDADAYLRPLAGRLVIIDEIHRVPTLFEELRGIIDVRRRTGHRTGQFLLLGSAALELMRQSETLTGRVVYVDLEPIGIEEAAAAQVDVDQLWLRGGFPESLSAPSDTTSYTWRRSFLRSYLERDVPMFAPRVAAETLGRLWMMIAYGQGTILNQARLAQSLGFSAPTVNSYLDLLADLKLLRRLQPWSGNIGKRLVRAPKVYVRDSGLVHALLEIDIHGHLLGHPVAGASWEGLVIENLIAAAGPRPAFFYRTSNGAEIDLLFEKGGRPVLAVEVKRSSAPSVEHGFGIACDDLDIRDRMVVYPGRETYKTRNGVVARPLLDAVEHVKAKLGR